MHSGTGSPAVGESLRIALVAPPWIPVPPPGYGGIEAVVLDGQSGFLVDTEDEMGAAAGRLEEIDPEECRRSVVTRYDTGVVAALYERAYREVIADRSVHPVEAALPGSPDDTAT